MQSWNIQAFQNLDDVQITIAEHYFAVVGQYNEGSKAIAIIPQRMDSADMWFFDLQLIRVDCFLGEVSLRRVDWP